MGNQNQPSVPANVEIEKALLGAVLLDNTLMDEAFSVLSINEFWLESHRKVYAAMIRLWGEDIPIDPMTLAEELMRCKELDCIGGLSFLSSLSDGVPKQSSLSYYISVLLDKSRARTVLVQADRLKSRIIECPDGETIDGAMSDFALKTSDLSMKDDGFKSLGSFGASFWEKLKRQKDNPNTLPGYSYSIPKIDEVTGGMRRGEITVIGARTGVGKSAFALGCCMNNARHGVVCGYRSDEMPGESFAARALSFVSSINGFKLRNPAFLSASEMNDLRIANEEIGKLPIKVDETAGVHIDQILSRCRETIRREGAELFVFDFIQRIKSSGQTMRDKVGYSMRAIADFSRSQNVATMVLSQITRSPDKKAKNPYPTMEDLKESGEIEENANCIILLWRSSEAKVPDQEKPGSYRIQKSDSDLAIIAKQRDGPANIDVPILFNTSTLTYESFVES